MHIMKTFGKLPLSFEANHGQSDANADFLARVGGYTIFLTPGEAVMALRQPREDRRYSLHHRLDSGRMMPDAGAKLKRPEPIPLKVLSLKFRGVHQRTAASGLEELPGKANYFIGNDPVLWRTNISTYAAVKYADIYPGIDVVFYGNGQQLEWDFVVASGADPDKITIELTGADQLSLDQQGNLVIQLNEAAICLMKPFVYQEINGTKTQISGEYDLQAGEQIKFRLAGYDTSQPLVIDPVLVYSTFLGGTTDDHGYGIAVDAEGNAYITGDTMSTNFPVQNPYQSSLSGVDAFVSKLNATGSALIYATYLGGNSFDSGQAIAVDADGYAYIAGETYSTNFPVQPTPGAFQLANAGGADAFVTKLARLGNSLIFSTYLGGTEDDLAVGIAIDSGDNVYVTGETQSSATFPRASASQVTFGGGADAFVTKLNATGTSLVYSTFLGGSGNERGTGIAVDGAGNAHVVGETYSDDFPTKNAIQPSKPASGFSDAFVAKYNLFGAQLYSTYLGGNDHDWGKGIAVDADRNVYVTGDTYSTTFPTLNSFQSSKAGDIDAFVTKINNAGSELIYSTYLGGSSENMSNGIAVSSDGRAYVTGNTSSTNFPVVNPIRATLVASRDVFITQFSPAGNTLEFSTYLGGNSLDSGSAIQVDSGGNIYITGYTASYNFPTVSPYQHDYAGGGDAFVAKIAPAAASDSGRGLWLNRGCKKGNLET